ncbi:M50 family metallopeptidase [Ensifer adhaerens]|uniref:M50 family metallopeptidase n=1 Tax=Ensifer adhaerens TaxID=106592 RepID=UPI001CBECBD1|nr:M50 family metallopeptidase [Ensifer adhaerens]MBZ7924402.1 M50 family metallopeptidase [Ensifer adhaerens]UAX96352.1 M50 family metallopeptidase [Ensifer adhaerens]UAY04305.1 M50 family metallopeptidase [Ensifer adhaerens]UAY12291.1 M50 family metallopeptidase [Ensifer adhaerens]
MPDNEKLKNAAHEIGHYVFARRYGVRLKFVSIMMGESTLPSNGLEKGNRLSDDEHIDFSLAGWAAETYVKTHSRQDDTFDQRTFSRARFVCGNGSGWPLGLLGQGPSDIAVLVRAGVARSRLLNPSKTLLGLGGIIHSQKVMFYRLVDCLLTESFLSPEALETVASGREITPEIRGRNESARMEALMRGDLFNVPAR